MFDLGSGLRVSVPTAIMAALSRASSQGLLIRSGRALEQLIDVDIVISERCSLKCVDCSNLMQYYVDPTNTDYEKIISSLKKLNVNLKLISDGDVSGALMVTNDKYNVDIFLGIGGGPEGVLAASAIDAYGCKFQGRFLFNNDKDLSLIHI